MTENQTLENLLNPLDLGDLALQIAAAEYSVPHKGDEAHPDYVDVAIKSLEDSCTDYEKVKWGGTIKDYKLAQAHARLNYENGLGYQLPDSLSQHFNHMKSSYKKTIDKSTVGDLNKALAKLGYGNKISADEKLNIKDILGKVDTDEKLKTASEQDKILAGIIGYALKNLTELARIKLTYGSFDSHISNYNEYVKPKEKAPQV